MFLQTFVFTLYGVSSSIIYCVWWFYGLSVPFVHGVFEEVNSFCVDAQKNVMVVFFVCFF